MTDFNYTEIKSGISQLPTIGSIAWWTIQDVNLARDTLIELFNRLNLPGQWLPAEIKPFDAFKKAINRVEPKSKFMFRPILNDPNKVVYGVVKEEKRTQEETLNYEVLNKITLLPFSKELFIENDSFPKGIIEGYYEHFKTHYVSIDIRKMLLNVIKDHLFSTTIRESGGVYFVAKKFNEWLEKLEALIPQISVNSRLYSLGILDTEKEREIVYECFKSEIEVEIATIYKELTEMDIQDTQQRTLTNRRNTLSLLERKVLLYENVLGQTGVMTEGLHQGIKLCRQLIDNAMPTRIIY